MWNNYHVDYPSFSCRSPAKAREQRGAGPAAGLRRQRTSRSQPRRKKPVTAQFSKFTMNLLESVRMNRTRTRAMTVPCLDGARLGRDQ
jgi:hypothetical protein